MSSNWKRFNVVLLFLAAFALALSGCSSSGDGTSVSDSGGALTAKVAGMVEVPAAKTVSAAAGAIGKVEAFDAYNNATALGTADVLADGSFTGLTFTLPAKQSVITFKATLTGPPAVIYYNMTPMDLTTPATGTGLTNNNVSISINTSSTAAANAVAAALGGTVDKAIPAATTFAAVQTSVVANGGSILSYAANGIQLSGTVGGAATKTTGTVDAQQFSFDDLKNIALDGKVLSASTAGDQPVVKFQVFNKATGEGITGLRSFALHIAQLQPEAKGGAAYWMNYIADGLPLTAMPAASAAPTNPSTDSVTSFNTDGTVKGQGYSVVDSGNGTYTVTFGAKIKANTKVVYDATLTHRVVVGVRSVAVPGIVGKTAGAYAGPVNPLTGAVFAQFTNTNGVNLVYDFIPSTGAVQASAHDIVTIDACNQCHYKIQYGFPRGNNTSGHFGSRTDTKTCVVCHTPQLASGDGRFTSFIHKIHMGEELPKVETAAILAGVPVNDVKYPQDIRNCVWCHKGTVKDSWQKPTREACGSCHNNVNFTTGANHSEISLIQTSDEGCVTCHTATIVDTAAKHVAVEPPDPNNIFLNTATGNNNTNASYLAAVGMVPAGATQITYVISSVTRNATTGNPSITFKLQKKGPTDTAPADVVFNTYSATKTEMIDGFVGSPSIYFAWSVAQDGITAPADYNATASTYIKNIWRGDHKDVKGAALAAASDGTLVKNADGTYTITLTGVNVPTTAKMLTGGVGYTYGLGTTLPLTQINLTKYPYTANPATVNAGVGGTGGLSVPAPNVWKVATGFTGRRLIVDNAKCNTCHGALGVKPTFHAGQRNDAQTCTFCHHVNRTNAGWPVNINYDVHAIHGAALRTNKFSWEVSAGAKYWEVGYPGLLKNCEMCHIAGMYDYSATASSSAVSSLLMTTAANGTTALPATISVITTGSETVPGTYYSPFVTAGATYGAAFAFNANTGVTTAPAATSLVLSPISAACSGCHDSTAAHAHMEANGGTVFGLRSDALTRTEQCLICHGPANNAAFNETVPAIKTVHRWW